jgi:hypothetical protein
MLNGNTGFAIFLTLPTRTNWSNPRSRSLQRTGLKCPKWFKSYIRDLCLATLRWMKTGMDPAWSCGGRGVCSASSGAELCRPVLDYCKVLLDYCTWLHFVSNIFCFIVKNSTPPPAPPLARGVAHSPPPPPPSKSIPGWKAFTGKIVYKSIGKFH